jgi:myxalamid-type nonribosomal peptide synthetase MxaA
VAEPDDGPTAPVATAETAARLQQDAHLGDGLSAAPGAAPSRPAEILFTGATGFLGGELAGALLRSTAARLHCVVRGQDQLLARERLDQLRRRLDADPGRLMLVEADLAGSRFATAPALAYQVDTVVHCAAAVNLFAPYEALRAANVLAARTVLEFATRGAPKALHFVSTIGVFLSPRYRGQTIREDADVGGAEGLRNGYAQSKWVADQMMARARARGVAVTVYRPAFVGWHAHSGHAGEHDLVALLLLSSFAASCAPCLDLQINSTPVDHVADAVARVVSLPAAQRGTYHLANRAAVGFVDLAVAAGLTVVDLDEWEAAVARKAPRFARFATLVRRAQTDPTSGSDELRLEYDRTYDDAHLRDALGAAYRAPPALDARYLARFISALPVG